MRLLWLAAFAFVAASPAAHAQDRIRLGEVLPALADTELGAIPLGAAPPAGASRIVHRGEVVAGLRAAGRSAAGLAIPSAVRVERRARVLSASESEAFARSALGRVAGSCRIDSVRVPDRITVPLGTPETRAEMAGRVESGNVSAVVVLSFGAQTTRVPFSAHLTCPPPEITPGAHVQIVVQIGMVRVSAAGEAREAGRIGDVIRVTNGDTGRALRGRVVDATTVELVR